MTTISIVVPVFNNATSLNDLFLRLKNVTKEHTLYNFEFIFIDDGSTDNSLQVLKGLQKQDNRVKILKLSRNFGSNPAIFAGMEFSEGNVVISISADLQDPPELISKMLPCWENGKKVVLAARTGRDDPLLDKLFSKCFYSLFRKFAVPQMPSNGFDVFLLDRTILNIVTNIKDRNLYLMGLILWIGFDPEIIYYHRAARKKEYGSSMWTIAKKIKYFIDSFTSFSYVPIRIVSIIGIAISFLGFLYTLIVVYIRLTGQVQITGWASTMILITLLSGFQLIVLGIFGEYIWRILEQSRERPRYLVEEYIVD